MESSMRVPEPEILVFLFSIASVDDKEVDVWFIAATGICPSFP